MADDTTRRLKMYHRVNTNAVGFAMDHPLIPELTMLFDLKGNHKGDMLTIFFKEQYVEVKG